METGTTDIMIKEVEDFKSVISAAPEALQKSIKWLDSAIRKGNELRARIDNGEMDDSLDQEINDHMVLLKQVGEKVNGNRTPFTRMMDNIKSRFTGIEKSFNDEFATFQKVRDAHAAKKRAEEAERERAKQLKIAKEKEAIELKSKLEQELMGHCEKILKEVKDKLYNNFNLITLEKFDAASNYFRTFKSEFTIEQYGTWSTFTGSRILNDDEVNAIVSEVKSVATFNAFVKRYQSEIKEVTEQLVDRLSGKKSELETAKRQAEEAAAAKAAADAQAAAAKSEAEKVAAEKAKQEAAEKERQAEEQRQLVAAREKQEAEAREKAEADAAAAAAQVAEINKEAAIANTLFDAEVNDAELSSSVAKGREGYEITVNAPAGWKLIFMMWWEIEGSKLTVEAIGKKKFDSMKGVCEKHAHKTGEKIESPLVTYTETFKTSVVKN